MTIGASTRQKADGLGAATLLIEGRVALFLSIGMWAT